jgi:hypothetical protein
MSGMIEYGTGARAWALNIKIGRLILITSISSMAKPLIKIGSILNFS